MGPDTLRIFGGAELVLLKVAQNENDRVDHVHARSLVAYFPRFVAGRADPGLDQLFPIRAGLLSRMHLRTHKGEIVPIVPELLLALPLRVLLPKLRRTAPAPLW